MLRPGLTEMNRIWSLVSFAVELSDTKCRKADIPNRTVIVLAPTAYRGVSRRYVKVWDRACSTLHVSLLSMLSVVTLLACCFWVCSLHTSPCKESTLCRSDASGIYGRTACMLYKGARHSHVGQRSSST